MTDYSKMSDIEINNAVAKSIGGEINFDEYGSPYRLDPCAISAYSGRDFDEVEFDPCNNPEDAWPIIVKYGIGIIPFKNGLSESWDLGKGLINGTVKDKNPLRAAMIVFLMMREAGK